MLFKPKHPRSTVCTCSTNIFYSWHTPSTLLTTKDDSGVFHEYNIILKSSFCPVEDPQDGRGELCS